MAAEVFAIAPAVIKSWWMWLVLIPVVIVIAAMGAAFYAIQTTRTATIEIGSDELLIHAGFYSRTIALADLDIDAARTIDLKAEPSFRPKWRTNGVGLPGLQAGWFRLRNKEKALLLLTDPSAVAYVPTRQGFSLLFSLPDPKAFLASLRNAS